MGHAAKAYEPELIAIRASSLGELFDCPARWSAKYILNMYIPSNGKAQLGTALHASTAVFDKSVIDQSGITIEEAAGAAVDAIYKPEYEVDWGDDKPKDAEKIALSLHNKYCKTEAPKHNYVAVEVKCDRLDISDIGLSLTGTTDRVRHTEEGYGIADIKTGKQAVSKDGTVNTKGHAYQMGVYELLAEFGSGLPITAPAEIIGLNTAKTEAAQRIGKGSIVGAREVLLGDDDRLGILNIASQIIHAGNFWGNPKSMLCHKDYCPRYKTCNFRR